MKKKCSLQRRELVVVTCLLDSGHASQESMALLRVSFLPQLSVQGLNHSREAPARLVQVHVARAQALAHGLLDRRAEQMRWVSVRADGVEVQRAREDSASPMSASSPAGHRRSRARRRGRTAHRQSALEHGERRRAFTANPRHVQVRRPEKRS